MHDVNSLNHPNRDYVRTMAASSKALAEAVRIARKGFNPATPLAPAKLPPAGNERGTSGANRGVTDRRSRKERIDDMVKQGFSHVEIARALKTSHQNVAAIANRPRELSAQARARYNAEKWG